MVAVLGQGLVPADAPILRADDLGAVRGDGVFETMHVRGGSPWLFEAHMARMARSAQRLELQLPDVGARRELARLACGAWPAEREGALRLVCTRGPEDGGPVTCYATIARIGPQVRQARRLGVRVATASLGYTADARGPAPWLLGGVKSLSYAVNMASQRWAQSRGFDDVLWLSSDGHALEGPTSTLVWLSGSRLCTVPTTTGILPGTTGRHLLDHAGDLGWRAAEEMAGAADLEAADGVWFTSSVRGIVPITQLDDVKLTVSPHTERIRELLGYPI